MSKIYNKTEISPMQRLLSAKIFGLNYLFIATFFILAIFFYLFPRTDIMFSSLFFDPERGFYLEHKPFMMIVYHGIYYVTTSLIVVYVLFIVASLVTKKKSIFNIPRKSVIFLLIVLAIGPGLIVNTLLKDNMGRARPFKVTEFGGELTFTPAFVKSYQCDNNCSFVSGHASMGFYPLAFAFIATTPFWRRFFLIGGGLSGIIVGMVRIVQGKHFLSDVIFAFYFTFMAAAIIYWIMYKLMDKPSSDLIIEQE